MFEYTKDQVIIGLMGTNFNNGEGYPIDVAMRFVDRPHYSSDYATLLAARTPEVLALEAANRAERSAAGIAG